MKRKLKLVIIVAVVGIVAFPVITLGRTFVSSLIEGKTVGEAIQILAQQLDSLTERVEVLETKPETQGQNTEGAEEVNTTVDEEAQAQLEREAREAFNLQKPEGKVRVFDEPQTQ